MHYRDKLNFWDSLNSLRDILQGKDSILVGDVNAIKSHSEKGGGLIIRDPFREKMEDLIVDLDLLDLPLKNGKYT